MILFLVYWVFLFFIIINLMSILYFIFIVLCWKEIAVKESLSFILFNLIVVLFILKVMVVLPIQFLFLKTLLGWINHLLFILQKYTYFIVLFLINFYYCQIYFYVGLIFLCLTEFNFNLNFWLNFLLNFNRIIHLQFN